jgi:hypothetical protein
VWCNAGDHVAHVTANAEEVDVGLVAVDAEAAAPSNGISGVCGSNERLRGHAAGVEAVSAHSIPLDEHDTRAHLCCAGRYGQPARACPDHTQINFENV